MQHWETVTLVINRELNITPISANRTRSPSFPLSLLPGSSGNGCALLSVRIWIFRTFSDRPRFNRLPKSVIDGCLFISWDEILLVLIAHGQILPSSSHAMIEAAVSCSQPIRFLLIIDSWGALAHCPVLMWPISQVFLCGSHAHMGFLHKNQSLSWPGHGWSLGPMRGNRYLVFESRRHTDPGDRKSVV